MYDHHATKENCIVALLSLIPVPIRVAKVDPYQVLAPSDWDTPPWVLPREDTRLAKPCGLCLLRKGAGCRN